MINLIVSIVFLLAASAASGATLYMGSGEAYTNLQSAMAAMSSGDTLIIRDGTYTGAANQIDNAHLPPNGSSGSFTTIIAENDGAVTFDGENARNMFYVTDSGVSYLKFQGIIWGRSSSENVVHIQGTLGSHNHHLYFSRCGAYDGRAPVSQSVGSGNGFTIRDTDYALIEDCYVWGEIYYGFLLERCTSSILRRCVGRYDLHYGDRGGIIGVYSSSNIEVQNCIAIDSNLTTYGTAAEQIYGFAYPTTDGPSSNVATRGSIILNMKKTGQVSAGLISSNGGGSGFTFNDVVMYDNSGGFWDRVTATTFNHCLFGKVSSGANISEGLASGGTANNSIFWNNYSYGSNITTSNYNTYYANGINARGALGAQDTTNVNPPTSGLLYLTRIEAGSAMATSGTSGTRRGPNILVQIGGTGTFYGDAGYNAETATPLWPWPQEAIIKAKFAAYTGNSNGTVNGARGFAASGTQLNGVSSITLTSYIWEYLGNTMPAAIYGGATVICHKDTDNDLYGDGTSAEFQACPVGYYELGHFTATTGDCNDNDGNINPGGSDICGQTDRNCDSVIDPCPTQRVRWGAGSVGWGLGTTGQ